MGTTLSEKTKIPNHLDIRVLTRILEEGYGPGAWHGNDMKAAVADVTAEHAFWRPGPERHNTAELALHHAFFVHQVRAQLAGRTPEPFVLNGQDWFALPNESVMTWDDIRRVLDNEQRQLAELVEKRETEPQPATGITEAFDLVLGITCHAVYHAAQIQLLKKLRSNEPTALA